MLGGSIAARVETITFDVEPDSLDLVVGATLASTNELDEEVEVVKSAFIYFVKESTCSIQWAFYVTNQRQGLKHVAFDPTLPSRIYGIIVRVDFGQ